MQQKEIDRNVQKWYAYEKREKKMYSGIQKQIQRRINNSRTSFNLIEKM